MTAQVDPTWWDSAVVDGRTMSQVLAERDIGAVFRFLHRRGFSRSRLAALTGLSETRVREVWHGRQQVSSYEVLERVAEGLRIPRGRLGLGYQDPDPGTTSLAEATDAGGADPQHPAAGLRWQHPPSQLSTDAGIMAQAPRPLSPYTSLRHFFGAELRAWRQRRGLSQAELGTRALHSGAEIGKVEKAERWPSLDLAERCDTALDTGGALARLWPLVDAQRRQPDPAAACGHDADTQGGPLVAASLTGIIDNGDDLIDQVASLGAQLVPVEVAIDGEDGPVPLQRRMFLMAGGAWALGGQRLLALPAPAPDPVPGRVGMPDIAELEQATDAMVTWDLRHGGRLAAEQGAALLRWALRLLRGDLPTPVRVRLYAAAGYLADRTGWAMFDCGRHDQAQLLFRQGLELADAAHDIDLRAQVLCDAASQRVFLGEADQALHLVADADAPGLAPPLVAAVHGVRAEAHAALGDDRRTWAQIAQAEDASTRPAQRPAPRWLTSFRDEAGMYASTGYAAFLLSRATDDATAGRQALDRLTRATTTLAPARSRGRVFGQARLAALHLTHHDGDLATGLDLTHQVLDQVGQVRSARLARELRTLRIATARHEQRTDVRQAGRQIERVLDHLG